MAVAPWGTSEVSVTVATRPAIVATAVALPVCVVVVPSSVALTVNRLLDAAVTLSLKVILSVCPSTVALTKVGATPSTLWSVLAATAVCVRVAPTVAPARLIVTPIGRLSLFAAKPSPSEASPAATV